MIGGNLSNLYFQTLYLSKEKSNCPLIADSLKIEKKIEKYDLVISQRYGKRILINSYGEKDSNDNFLEIVDYDPIKKILLAMGSKEPRIETPLHWLIHHARDEVNAIVQINDIDLANKIKKIPKTQNDYTDGNLDHIKDVMKNLRKSKKVILKNHGLIFVGNSIKEVEELLFEELK